MKLLTPIKAIRANCIDCSGGSRFEARMCEHKKCPMWPYRLGKHPKLKGKGRKDAFKKKTSTQLDGKKQGIDSVRELNNS